MFVSYAEDPQEIEIAGTASEFVELSAKLLENGAVYPCQESGMEVAPYSRFLRCIAVKIAPGERAKLAISDDDCLLISGDARSLEPVSETMVNFAKGWAVGQHIHIEYYEGHPTLAPGSIPAVLAHL